MAVVLKVKQVDLSDAPRFVRSRHLREQGWTRRGIADAVASGGLQRVRQGAFCAPDAPADCVTAGRVRGLLTCVSELSRRGVFVKERPTLHVHVSRDASRAPKAPHGVRVHRNTLHRIPHPQAMSVEPFDAILHAVLCQDPRAALATLDSALHHRLIDEDDLSELFDALPRRYRSLKRLVDRRAESGPETIMRLILRSIGCAFEVQVSVPGVGRVDFVVGGWLIIECDSEEFHSSWEDQKRDRWRDQSAAKRGFATFRPIAEDIMWHGDVVRAAVVGLLAGRRRRP